MGNKAKIKICGLSRAEDIQAANELKPEYIGFVFYEKSKRNVSEEQAAGLRETLAQDIIPVGVFVEPPMDMVLRLLRRGTISIAQLHGGESEEYIRELKSRLSEPGQFQDGTKYHTDGSVIKAVLVRTPEDLKGALDTSADYLLLDQGLGSGETFDWDMARDIMRDFSKPFFLAGGLDAYNVKAAIDKLHPYAVDISSNVETEGVKDKSKIKAFIDAVRR